MSRVDSSRRGHGDRLGDRPERDRATRRQLIGAAIGALPGALLIPASGAALAAQTPVVPSPQSAATPAAQETNIRTDAGPVRGLALDGYSLFQGIPYAAPPVGDLRWRAPEPVESWAEPRDATMPGNPAPQTPGTTSDISSIDEDCLYLNVTTPDSARSGQPRPVMVWIHGGGNAYGAGSLYDPRRLAVDEDVVVVTINYRLGIFGAFGYPGLDDGGAFGLQDQVAALRWVQRNALAFGGDANNVTIFGQSHGALSVTALLASPMTAGLFHRAIIQSGMALGDYPPSTLGPGSPAIPSLWVTPEEIEQTGVSVAGDLGVPDSATALEELRALPVEALLPISPLYFRYAYGNGTLPEDPAQVVRDGRTHRVPVISGATRDEGRTFVAVAFTLADQPVTERSYPELLRQAFGDATERVRQRYPLADYDTPDLAWSTIVTDRIWALPIMEQHRLLDQQMPTFAYEFADRDAPSALLIEIPPDIDLGAHHGSEAAYQFAIGGEEADFTPDQWQLAENMDRYWANFARSGDPNGPGMPQWPAFGDAEHVQSLGPGPDGIQSVDYAVEHHLEFWESLA